MLQFLLFLLAIVSASGLVYGKAPDMVGTGVFVVRPGEQATYRSFTVTPQISAIAFHPQSPSVVLVGFAYCFPALYDLESENMEVLHWEALAHPIVSSRAHPDRFLIGAGNGILAFDAETGEAMHEVRLHRDDDITSFDVSDDGNGFVAGTRSGVVYVAPDRKADVIAIDAKGFRYELKDDQEGCRPVDPTLEPTRLLPLSRESEVAGNCIHGIIQRGDNVKVNTVRKSPTSPHCVLVGHDRVRSVSFVRDHNEVLFTFGEHSRNGLAVIYDVSEGRAVATFLGYTVAAVARVGRERVLLLGKDNQIDLFDVRRPSAQPIATLTSAARQRVVSLQVCPKGTYVVVGSVGSGVGASRHDTMTIWHISERKQLWSRSTEKSLWAFDCSTDGYVVYGEGTSIELLDVQTGRTVARRTLPRIVVEKKMQVLPRDTTDDFRIH